MVGFLLEQLRYDPDLTLRQLADRLENEMGVRVAPQTIKNHVDAACFTMKQLHKEPQYMNTSVNKEKRRDYLVSLQEYQAAGKVILYMDETNFNLRSTRTRGRSLMGKRAVKKVFAGGGQNMHVIACISEHALVYFETRFGSNRYTNTNDFVRGLLRHVAQQGEISLSDVVLVLDNAPCHCRNTASFGSVSTFKASVKAFMRERRLDILAVPEGVKMKDHRQSFLHEAAHLYMPQAASTVNCRAFYRHTLRFHFMVSNMDDMPVGM
ncbi:hypothetical protein PR002_g5081 [Phytophthora rubi]|uniref:Tc1-like transposase DDE domain-containing protein n=1 Tax=Phytophthora rubi TaxID=129364 RepID=A0A6A3NGQ5_9STRA|nr:hypothetical protein PR002_g5081 [Phytophthora rubi]